MTFDKDNRKINGCAKSNNGSNDNDDGIDHCNGYSNGCKTRYNKNESKSDGERYSHETGISHENRDRTCKCRKCNGDGIGPTRFGIPAGLVFKFFTHLHEDPDKSNTQNT